MTPTLKEQIEQWIDREASNRFKSHQLMTAHLYKAGAHSILPMLLVALDTLESYKSAAFDLNGTIYKVGYRADKALNKIKSIMEGNGNGNLQKVQQNTEC